MSKARKLPSGKWRCRAFVKMSDGTIERPSFTADTKAEAERLARQFETEKDRMANVLNLTIYEATERYIESKKGVLSPTTIKGYDVILKNRIVMIKSLTLRQISSADIQQFISNISCKVSAKSVKNTYSLLMAVLAMYVPDKRFRATLPPKEHIVYDLPTDAEVQMLYKHANNNLKKAILLAAICTLRRGEISALRYQDISYDLCRISIHADMIKGIDGKWIYKDHPKTDGSIRIVSAPRELLQCLGTGEPDEYVVKENPQTITGRFCELRDSLGLHCRFHDLRHYSASVRAIIQPRAYTAADGGWNPTSTVLDTVYVNPLADKRREYQTKVNNYFVENLLNKDDSEPESNRKEA